MTRSVSSILPFNPDPFCRQIQNVVQNAVPSFPGMSLVLSRDQHPIVDRKSSFKDNAANLTTTIERWYFSFVVSGISLAISLQ